MTTRRRINSPINFIARFISDFQQRRANRKRMDALRHHTAIGTVSSFNAAQARDQGSFEAGQAIAVRTGHS